MTTRSTAEAIAARICDLQLAPTKLIPTTEMVEVIAFGRVLYQRDLQVYRTCVETGTWPGWGERYEDCGLPSWEMKQLENAMP